MQPDPIVTDPIIPMPFHSSFVDAEDLDQVALPKSPLEMRIGIAAAIAFGGFGIVMLVTLYMVREEIALMAWMLVGTVDFLSGGS